MDFDVMMALIGLTVAAMAAILGIWMERDPEKPPRYSYALSALILMATGVGMFQSWSDHQDSEKMKEDMARMLQMLDKIAQSSETEHPELNEFVRNEVTAQSRSNPRVVQKLAQRMADEGTDPSDMLGSYMPAADVEGLQRGGRLTVKAKAHATTAAGATTPAVVHRPRTRFGQPRPEAKPTPTPTPTTATPPAPPAKPEAETKEAKDHKEGKDKDHKEGKPATR
jgi:hypothetical protein